MNNKIRLVSRSLKWLVVLLSLTAFGYLLLSYFVAGKFNFNSDSQLFVELWQQPQADKNLLMLMSAPAFILWGLIVFWAYRLFSCFEQAEYFSAHSVNCYVWLVWLHVALFVQDLLREFVLAYYHAQFFEETIMELGLDLGRLITLSLLISIVHILKHARQVELENKEFV